MKSHGKSKAVLSAIIFEVNLLQSSRFGDTYRRELAKYQQQIERLADIREWGIWLL